ncbi:MAG: hypothetical protein U5K37_03720 [Natrialbaceae archaeon]|nr:hypothetical protein [Natrialbaceae archaeon]
MQRPVRGMANLQCPLCPDTFESDADLRIHLEVEHRKSEIVEVWSRRHSSVRTDPVIESDGQGDIEEASSQV